jgi:hypothetical protein
VSKFLARSSIITLYVVQLPWVWKFGTHYTVKVQTIWNFLSTRMFNVTWNFNVLVVSPKLNLAYLQKVTTQRIQTRTIWGQLPESHAKFTSLFKLKITQNKRTYFPQIPYWVGSKFHIILLHLHWTDVNCKYSKRMPFFKKKLFRRMCSLLRDALSLWILNDCSFSTSCYFQACGTDESHVHKDETMI